MPRFTPGQSGNPAGRKRGTPDRRTQARELFAQHREALIDTAVRLALAGDPTALRLCLDRVVPALKPAAEAVTLPELPQTLAGKGEAILRQLGAGTITPDQAATILAAFAAQARIVEITELEQRVTALEAPGAKP
jgi:hypothetical protein